MNRQLELARALLRCHIVHFVLVYCVKILKDKNDVNVYCLQHHGNPRLPTSEPLTIILVVCTITILCARAVNSVMLVCWLLICLPAPHWTFTWNCSGHQERRCWFLWRTQFQRAKSYRRQSGQNIVVLHLAFNKLFSIIVMTWYVYTLCITTSYAAAIQLTS